MLLGCVGFVLCPRLWRWLQDAWELLDPVVGSRSRAWEGWDAMTHVGSFAAALNPILSAASLLGWFTTGERCPVPLVRDWTSEVAPGRVKIQDNYLQAPVKHLGRLRLIPAGDSLARGQQIPIVRKCQRLYLKRGSELGAGIPHVLGGLC